MNATVVQTMPTSSWELVTAAQQGDIDATDQLYRIYAPYIRRTLLGKTHDHHLSEDLTSETFLRALSRIGSLTYQQRDVGAWLLTIARNLFLDHVKTSRYRYEIAVAEMLDSTSDDLNPESVVIARAEMIIARAEVDKLSSRLTEAIDQLAENQRKCITMRFLDGLSLAETAKVMDRHPNSVMALLKHGLRNLAKLIPQQTGCDS